MAGPQAAHSIQLLSARSPEALEALAARSGTHIGFRVERRGDWHTLRAGCFERRAEAEAARAGLVAAFPRAMVRRAVCDPSPRAVGVADAASPVGGPAPVAHATSALAPQSPYAEAPWIHAGAVALAPVPVYSGELNSMLGSFARLEHTPAGQPLLREVFGEECDPPALADARRRLLEARRRQLAADRGLRFEAGVHARDLTDAGGIDDLDGDTASRAYAGVAWELLRDGRHDHRVQALVLEHEIALHDLEARRAALRAQKGCRHTRLIRHFSSWKEQLLRRAERLLEAERALTDDSYFAGSVPRDDVIRADARLERTRQRLAAALAQTQFAAPAPLQLEAATEPPLLDIALERLAAAVRDDPAAARANELRRQIAEARRSPWADARLKLYVRPVANLDSGQASGASVAAGVQFSTPILEDKREIWAAEDSVFAAEEELRVRHTVDATRRAYAEFNAALDDGIKLHHQRQEVVEHMRRALALNVEGRSDGGNAPALIQAARDLVDTQFEIIENKQRLYTHLGEVFAAAGIEVDDKYLLPVAEPAHTRLHPGHRGLYLWSEAFNRLDNPTLIAIAHSKRISALVVSAGKRSDAGKLDRLIAEARVAGVRVELLGGTPEWVLPARAEDAVHTIGRWFQRSDHVHLDVEPHTLRDWPARRAEHFAGLAALVERAAGLRRPGQTLSVAVPMSLERDEIARLPAHADRLVVMAYETNRSETIVRRLERFSEVPRDKLAIALRPQDYTSEQQLEARIAELKAALGIDHYVLHDIEHLMDMAR